MYEAERFLLTGSLSSRCELLTISAGASMCGEVLLLGAQARGRRVRGGRVGRGRVRGGRRGGNGPARPRAAAVRLAAAAATHVELEQTPRH